MKSVEETILNILKKNFEGKIEIMPDRQQQLKREHGIDSFTLVKLIINIEEEYGLDLDEYMGRISQSKTVDDIINIVEEACKQS